MKNTININGLDINIPANTSVVLDKNGAITFIPITPKKSGPKTVHINKHGQKITTAHLAQEVIKAKKVQFLSTEELATIKTYFLAKGGCVSRLDADTLATQSGIPAGKIGYRFNKLRQSVCYGFLTVPDTDAFQTSMQANGGWMANLYTNLNIAKKREANRTLAIA